jgi:hypothetical protein
VKPREINFSSTGMAAVFTIWLLLQVNSHARQREATSNAIDLRAAHIVVPNDRTGPEKKAVELLVDEIAARTRIRLTVNSAWPANAKTPVIAVGSAAALKKFSGRFTNDLNADGKQLRPEGFRIHAESPREGPTTVLVAGNDARGVLFGVGKLLRSLRMTRDRIELPIPLDVSIAPAMAIRGHQLGYRPKTNSYDAWDLAQWEQYIRDLAVFGCNSIELIPPRSDDDADSPHFPLPQMEMMIGVSQLAADYGLDVWIWYPAMELRYSSPEAIDAAVKEWGEVLSKLPRVDALFVPSGDPGDAPPDEFMAMLAQQAEQLKCLHPNAKIWISMQSFTQPQFDQLLEILKREPDWLGGIVHGPQTRIRVAKLREALPRRYPIRGYPDITHSMRCEYPVPDWDLAYALTEGRETINPRPLDESKIFRLYKDHAHGVITYSEGCNDDVNKMIWSGLCWDPNTRPIDTLREYSRYFIGDKYADDFAQGLFALEQNWRGPLLTNDGVMSTLQHFREMERTAEPRTLRNWRFQQALYRANYDAYQHCRLVEETAQESEAMDVLARARQVGASRAIDHAETILNRADSTTSADALAARVKELAEALFQSIGMQLSVQKYRAIDTDRGANLDELDVPRNNRRWLKARFHELRKLDNDPAKLRGIDEILHWTDPGPGGFYDDLGNPSLQPHLAREDLDSLYAKDPGFLETPSIGFDSEPSWRRSWCTHVDGLYQTPIALHYSGLDPQAQYQLRVVYIGDDSDVKVRLVATMDKREIEVHPFQAKPQPVRPVDFEIPIEATSRGELTLKWQSNPERGGPGRGCKIAEVWLIKAQKP